MDQAEFRRRFLANLIETKGTGTCKAEDSTPVYVVEGRVVDRAEFAVISGLSHVSALADIEAAKQFRERHGFVGRGGVVVLYNGEGQSWVNELRNPEEWRPGCVAVDEAGNTWTAVAGDEQNGATMWMPNDSTSWASKRFAKAS